MAERLWPRAWEILGLLVLMAFGWLEDAAYRRKLHPKHVTLSRRLKRLLGRSALLICTVAGFALGVHLARLEADLIEAAQESRSSHG